MGRENRAMEIRQLGATARINSGAGVRANEPTATPPITPQPAGPNGTNPNHCCQANFAREGGKSCWMWSVGQENKGKRQGGEPPGARTVLSSSTASSG